MWNVAPAMRSTGRKRVSPPLLLKRPCRTPKVNEESAISEDRTLFSSCRSAVSVWWRSPRAPPNRWPMRDIIPSRVSISAMFGFSLCFPILRSEFSAGPPVGHKEILPSSRIAKRGFRENMIWLKKAKNPRGKREPHSQFTKRERKTECQKPFRRRESET